MAMGAYAKSVRAPVLLLLLIICLATHSQYGSAQGVGSERINVPNGLCIRSPGSDPCKLDFCYCCLVDNECFQTMDRCTKCCQDPASCDGGRAGMMPTASISAQLPSDFFLNRALPLD
uniref:Uncharacterized protein n=1 Tax=Avena sativa TaxID=4498 RepID=A0ACD5YQ17_AVESA